MSNDMVGFPPRVYLIGAQKAGTTYLASLIDQHPKIQVSDPKETDFYTGRVYPKGSQWYKKCFSGEWADKVLIDASTSYTAAFDVNDPRSKDLTISFNGVAQRIKKDVPDARLIYLLRNPIRRTYSAYWHFVRAGVEKRSFHEVITQPDDMSEYYLLLSDYHAQIEHYLQHFDSERIKLIVFEEFIQDSEFILEACFDFLHVDPTAHIEWAVGKHTSFQYSGGLSRINQMLAPLGGIRPILGTVKNLLPQALVERGMQIGTKKIPKIDQTDYSILADYFAPRIEKLEKLTGREFADIWRPE